MPLFEAYNVSPNSRTAHHVDTTHSQADNLLAWGEITGYIGFGSPKEVGPPLRTTEGGYGLILTNEDIHDLAQPVNLEIPSQRGGPQFQTVCFVNPSGGHRLV